MHIGYPFSQLAFDQTTRSIPVSWRSFRMREKASASMISWLQNAGLERYIDVFTKEDISVEDLPHLTESDIDRLELPIGPRRKLLTALASVSAVAEAPPTSLDSRYITADRRQLTVMFCDLVGSTALAERLDPEESKAVMRNYRGAVSAVVEEYRGHVKQFQGDGVKIYFGWPHAHEDAAERCIRAALEVVAAVQAIPIEPALEVKIGIATGEVAVDEEDAVGATPNRAARLQDIASPNQIVMADSTRRLVGSVFELSDLGLHSLKGVPEPLQAWLVGDVSRARSRFEASRGSTFTPLVGRDDVVNQLLQYSRRRVGQVVFLSGEPGIGKSRVLREIQSSLKDDGIASLPFQCLPYHADSAYWPVIDYFERRLEISKDDGNQVRFEKLRTIIESEVEDSEQALPLIASLLSIASDGLYEVPAMTPQKQKEVTGNMLLELVALIAYNQPTVLFFEDLHWIDASTLDLLDQLIDRAKHLPLLVVLTHRPDFENRWAELDHVRQIELSRLSTEQSELIVRKIAEQLEVSEHLIDELVVKSDGVPLFVEEMTKLVLEQLSDSDHPSKEIAADAGISIPASLRDSLRARLDRDAKVMQIAQIGSVIGREFSYELLSNVAIDVLDVSSNGIDEMLERLIASELAFSKGSGPEAVYAFKHALVREEAYNSIPKTERLPELHWVIARAMEAQQPDILDNEPELIAHHYSSARRPDKAANLWMAAGNNALGKWTLQEAITHFNRCLGEIEKLPADVREEKELECRLLLSLAYEAYGGWPSRQLADVLEPALPLARKIGAPMALARTLWGLWVQQMSVGPVQDSLRWAEECLATGFERGDEELEMVGRMAVMVGNFWLGNHVVVREHAEAILALYDRDRHAHIVHSMNHDPKTLAGIYLSLVMWILGYPDQGVALVEERDAHARSVGHPFDTGFVLTLGAWIYHYRREPEELQRRHEEILALADDAGLPFISLVLSPFLSTGIYLTQQGHLEQGISDMQSGIGFWEGAGARAVTPYVKSRLGDALASTGDLEAGLAQVEEALAQIEKPGWQERSHIAEILRLKGNILVKQGQPGKAEACYLESIEWARKQAAKTWELRTSTSLAALWKDQHRDHDARALLAPVYTWFREGFDTRDLIEAKAMLDSLS